MIKINEKYNPKTILKTCYHCGRTVIVVCSQSSAILGIKCTQCLDTDLTTITKEFVDKLQKPSSKEAKK